MEDERSSSSDLVVTEEVSRNGRKIKVEIQKSDHGSIVQRMRSDLCEVAQGSYFRTENWYFSMWN
jgi:hypothetical protein